MPPMDDDQIRTLLTTLSRPHPSGGDVVERVAILAAGGDFRAILAWIDAHDGTPEALAPVAHKGGLHGSRLAYGVNDVDTTPLRFVLPAGALA